MILAASQPKVNFIQTNFYNLKALTSFQLFYHNQYLHVRADVHDFHGLIYNFGEIMNLNNLQFLVNRTAIIIIIIIHNQSR